MARKKQTYLLPYSNRVKCANSTELQNYFAGQGIVWKNDSAIARNAMTLDREKSPYYGIEVFPSLIYDTEPRKIRVSFKVYSYAFSNTPEIIGSEVYELKNDSVLISCYVPYKIRNRHR